MAYEILLYDDIGPSYFGLLDAKWMMDELAKAGGGAIDLRINSQGGDVIDAHAMVNAMARYPGEITAYVDAMAASAASVVAVAASKVVIAKNAMMMIHNAWTIAAGNANELEKTAGILRKVDENITDAYVDKTGQDKARIVEWMNAETWFRAQEAVDAGLADQIGPSTTIQASVAKGRFRNAPAEFGEMERNPRAVAASLRRKVALARARFST